MIDPARLPERNRPDPARAALAASLDAYGRRRGTGDVRRPRRVVLFAGGGGSSIAIKQALGSHPDAALNHWPLALSVHQRNFPDAEHYCADVMETDCRTVLPGEPIQLLWLSPDCRHFSVAKGGAIVSPRIRALAWCAIPWAKLRRPGVIMLENVEAFLTWCPVVDGKPDLSRKGETFRLWLKRLQQCGYVVEWRVLNAADYGAPTSRKRLFLVARSDGEAIVWPEPTHAARGSEAVKSGRLKPWASAASIIDFTRDCPSIFLTKEQARAKYGRAVKRPLEPATHRRIAMGLFRYTIASGDPFIVRVTQRNWGGDRAQNVRGPLPVVTTSKGGEFAVVAATITKFRRGSAGDDAREPLAGVTANSFIKRPGCGIPLGLVAADLRAVHMEQANTGMVGHDAREPTSTMVGKGCTQRVIAASLTVMRGSNQGTAGDAAEPVAGLSAQGQHTGLIAAALDSYYATGCGSEIGEPMRAATAQARHSLITAALAAEDDDASWSRQCVLAFLREHFGQPTAEDYADPLGSAESRARFGLVLVQGVVMRITDIGMRMLDPETELAAAMGVGVYDLSHDADGKPVTKTNITKMVGNMVSPPPARALIAANLPHDDFNLERAAA